MGSIFFWTSFCQSAHESQEDFSVFLVTSLKPEKLGSQKDDIPFAF